VKLRDCGFAGRVRRVWTASRGISVPSLIAKNDGNPPTFNDEKHFERAACFLDASDVGNPDYIGLPCISHVREV
jgi:hypothetical protein